MKKTFKEASIDCMIDEVCRAYGLEARVTIQFCKLCEKSDNYILIKAKYNKLIKNNDGQINYVMIR